MNKFLFSAIALAITTLSWSQANNDPKRAAALAKVKMLAAVERRMSETRPQRRDSPLRADNIRDQEVREIQAVVSSLYSTSPPTIVNISGVVLGCPCEDGPACKEQVWVLTNRFGKHQGFLISRIDNHWELAALQRWWLEYENFQVRSKSARSLFAYYEEDAAIKERFPKCGATPATANRNEPPLR